MRLLAKSLILPTLVAGSLLLSDTAERGLLAYSELPRLLAGEDRRTEFWQNHHGARALLWDGEMYLRSDEIVKDGTSTHPPTSFLFALPLTALPLSVATPVWMALMAAAVTASLWAVGLPRRAVLTTLPALALFPPVAWGLFNTVPIWMAGLALAYRYRHRSFAAGILIGLASLPKFFAAATLLPYLARRDGRAMAGFVAVWAAALSLVTFLRPDALPTYLAVQHTNGLSWFAYSGNGSLWALAEGGLGFPWGFLWIGLPLAALGLWLASGRLSDTDRWAGLTWLGIAVLPLVWSYSLLPLLPWLVRALWQGERIAGLLAAVTLTILAGTGAAADRPALVAFALLTAGLVHLLPALRLHQTDTLDDGGRVALSRVRADHQAEAIGRHKVCS